jgi:1-acyl-sn-glycerol-3-phosphate acyltransferase
MFLIKDIKGLDNIPKNGAFIVASNHVSYLDPVIIPAILVKYFKRKVHYLAKKELFEGWIGSAFQNATGGILLDREKGGKITLKNALNMLKRGKVIGIFPEGTRSKNGKLQKGKTGVARLALAARVPVVPVGLRGTFALMPRGRVFPKLKKNVKVNFGKPILFKKYYGKQNKTIFRKVTTIIMEKIAELSKQKYKQ